MIKSKKAKIIIASIVVVTSLLAVGFNSKIELINGDHINLTTNKIVDVNWDDKFEFVDDKILFEIDGEIFDITEYCSLDSDEVFTYEKQVGNHIEKIAITGEPNTKFGIGLAKHIGYDKVSQEIHHSTGGLSYYFNTQDTTAERLGYCCKDKEQTWFDDAQAFLNVEDKTGWVFVD